MSFLPSCWVHFDGCAHVTDVIAEVGCFECVHACVQESFVYNIAMNRLDVYTFDTWNMNQCRYAVQLHVLVEYPPMLLPESVRVACSRVYR
jgi:hypothetical protein